MKKDTRLLLAAHHRNCQQPSSCTYPSCDCTCKCDDQRTALTTVYKNGVLYVVHEARGTKTVFARFVRFGKTKANRVGGAAFREAAREQERVAGVPCIETLVNRQQEVYV